MTTRYNIGDLVKIKPIEANLRYVNQLSTFDPYMTFVVVRNSIQDTLDVVSIRPEGTTGLCALAIATKRIEPFGVWAEHQRPVSDEKALAALQNAVPSGYLAASQRAWDAFAESRRKMVPGYAMPAAAQQDFNDIYAYGYENAAQKYKAVAFAAQSVKPLARKGEADPAISKGRAGKLTDMILLSLQAEGPGTAAEIADRIGEDLQSITPRFAPLKRRGLIHVSSGQKVGRGTRSVYSIGGGPL